MTTNNSKDNTLRLSIIVPAYNTEKYLDDCILSLLNQDLPEDEYEIIFVNDGSTDNSVQVIEKYMENHPCIRLISQQNAGVSAARNNGIRLAKGEYIGFVDSDDYIDSDMYRNMLSLAEKEVSDVCMCGFFSFDECGNIYESHVDFDSTYTTECEDHKLLLRFFTNNYNGLASVCNKIFKNSLIKNNDIHFDETMIIAEDEWFVFCCLLKAYRVDFIKKSLYFYRNNKYSAMHRFYDDQYLWWKTYIQRELKVKDELRLKIDLDSFYSVFLYRVAVYIRDLVYLKKNKSVFKIFNDEFYIEAIKHRKRNSKKTFILHTLVHYKMKRLALLVYKIWAKKYYKHRDIII